MSGFDGSPFDTSGLQLSEANGAGLAENSVSQLGSNNSVVSLGIPPGFFTNSTATDPYSGSATIDLSPSAVAPATPSFSDQLKAFEKNPLGAILGDFGTVAKGAVGAVTGSGSSGTAAPSSGFFGITISRVVTIIIGLLIFASGVFLLGRTNTIEQVIK